MKAFKTFPFSTLHHGKFYQYKKVEVRYLTVISRFFS